jgi:hypothetical protein
MGRASDRMMVNIPREAPVDLPPTTDHGLFAMTDFLNGASLVHLSASARHVLSIDAGRAYAKSVVDAPGAIEARDVLESLKPADVIAGRVRDLDAAGCVLAGLWLWHDFLEPAHLICQSIQTPSGAMWHAIVHRREGDFSNAKYWYRQAASHPMTASMTSRVDAITHEMPSDKALFKLTAAGWNPQAFVDLAQAVHTRGDEAQRRAVASIQQLEWQALFEHDLRSAAT